MLSGCVALVWVCGCPESDPAVVAVFDNGRVTSSDLDQAVLRLPPSQRLLPAGDRVAWYERIVEDMVVERLLLRRGEAASDTPEVRQLIALATRQARAERLLRQRLPEVAAPSEDELLADYRANPVEHRRPARRSVYHIFLRRDAGTDTETLRVRGAELRRRVLAGEAFEEIAAQVSDSESRHDRGALGWVGRDDLPAELAEIIFALPVGAPSDPVLTREGAHLFLVRDAVPERQHGFEEVRHRVAERITEERRTAAIEDLLAELPQPPGSFVPTREAFARIEAADDPRAEVLGVGEVRLDLESLRRLVAEQRLRGAGEPLDSAWRTLRAIAARELLLFGSTAPAVDDEEAGREPRRRALVGWARYRALRDWVEKEPGALHRFYQDNQARFSTPLRLAVMRLRVPFGEQPARAMARLEDFAARDGGGLEALARELGGEVDILPAATLGELATRSPKLARFCVALEAGDRTPPFREGDNLWLARLEERREPEPLAFHEVRDRVIAAYLQVRLQEVYADLRQGLLAEADLRIFRQRLAR